MCYLSLCVQLYLPKLLIAFSFLHFAALCLKNCCRQTNRVLKTDVPSLLCLLRCRPLRTWRRSWRRLAPWSLSLVTCCAQSPPCLTSEPHPQHFQRHCCARARSATHAGNHSNWFGINYFNLLTFIYFHIGHKSPFFYGKYSSYCHFLFVFHLLNAFIWIFVFSESDGCYIGF